MSSFTVILQYMSIYYGIPVLVAGMSGGIVNTIIFLSLQTFRQNSCAFYLTIMSIVNVGQLFTGLLSRIMISGYGIDWTETSPFYCKFRYFLLHTCTLISLSCICFATIDQYFATSSNRRWRQWSNLKVAYRLTISMSIFWSLHGILYLVFYARIYSSSTGEFTCEITNDTFGRYHVYVYFLILRSFLPITINIIFALLAFRNIGQLAYHTVPLVRRELDKQLTIMVIVQAVLNACTLLPSSIIGALQKNAELTSNANVAATLQFAYIISVLVYYLNSAVSINCMIKIRILCFKIIFRVRFTFMCVYLNDFVDS